ncbi:hypothetical protein M5K25_017496 [Dendrobium thyrsiflorum]|uniref:Uncharacterized protein n=1 Tax=Dendrobium thyrsiflorum TaxID=117978 RepID=A0ABD0UN69_DENTH
MEARNRERHVIEWRKLGAILPQGIQMPCQFHVGEVHSRDKKLKSWIVIVGANEQQIVASVKSIFIGWIDIRVEEQKHVRPSKTPFSKAAIDTHNMDKKQQKNPDNQLHNHVEAKRDRPPEVLLLMVEHKAFIDLEIKLWQSVHTIALPHVFSCSFSPVAAQFCLLSAWVPNWLLRFHAVCWVFHAGCSIFHAGCSIFPVAARFPCCWLFGVFESDHFKNMRVSDEDIRVWKISREERYNGVATMDRRRRLENRDEVIEKEKKEARHSSQAIIKPAGFVDVLRSPFFDINPEVDNSVEEYVERIIFTLSNAIEKQLSTVQWQITAKPRQCHCASLSI